MYQSSTRSLKAWGNVPWPKSNTRGDVEHSDWSRTHWNDMKHICIATKSFHKSSQRAWMSRQLRVERWISPRKGHSDMFDFTPNVWLNPSTQYWMKMKLQRQVKSMTWCFQYWLFSAFNSEESLVFTVKNRNWCVEMLIPVNWFQIGGTYASPVLLVPEVAIGALGKIQVRLNFSSYPS